MRSTAFPQEDQPITKQQILVRLNTIAQCLSAATDSLMHAKTQMMDLYWEVKAFGIAGGGSKDGMSGLSPGANVPDVVETSQLRSQSGKSQFGE